MLCTGELLHIRPDFRQQCSCRNLIDPGNGIQQADCFLHPGATSCNLLLELIDLTIDEVILSEQLL